jgi:dihydropteroate synthase
MLAEGADCLDIGGESTRPGSRPVPPEEQLKRVLPVVRGLRAQTDAPLSVDTQSPEVAVKALESGVDIVNDVSACRDPGWQRVLEEWNISIILMHMRGTPLDMQASPEYPDGVVPTVTAFFQERLESLQRWGVRPERTILDPGIGFGKRVQHNLELIRSIDEFQSLGRPIFIGASRKGFIQKILAGDETDVTDLEKDRDIGTLMVHAVAICRGAHFLRVHNVSYTRALVRVFDAVLAGTGRN